MDYTLFEDQLKKIDTILEQSGIQILFVGLSMEEFQAKAEEQGQQITHKMWRGYQHRSVVALRCTILNNLLGGSYRELSRRLAECPLFRWFCRLEEFEQVRVCTSPKKTDTKNWLTSGF